MKNKKLFILFAVAFTLVFAAFELFARSGLKFSYEEQAYLRCLPIELTLTTTEGVNKSDVERGMLVVVNTKKYEKYYRKGAKILKVVVGMPGDQISINEGIVRVNGEFISTYQEGELAEFPPFRLGTFTLQDNEFWLSGSTSVSLDSRYIGPVHSEVFIGRGYAII